MPYKSVPYILAALLLTLAALSYVGCFPLLVYRDAYQEVRVGCPGLIVCNQPHCKRVEENGSFEYSSGLLPVNTLYWYGDNARRDRGLSEVCTGEWALVFENTSPGGASVSQSAQVYQRINLGDHTGDLSPWKRVRAQAAFKGARASSDTDNQFGLHLAVYSGDWAAFPFSGVDYESLSPNTPEFNRLSYKTNFFFVDDNEDTWEVLQSEIPLPNDADFLVVVLEAVENVINDTVGAEFSSDHMVDVVEVVLDKGPIAPIARDDTVITNEDVPVAISVLNNDTDDGVFERETLTILDNPDDGSLSFNAGVITYTPDENVFGTDAFSYIVADNDGLFSNTALVTIGIHPVNDVPLANDDTYQLQGFARLTINTPGILTNDIDLEDNVLSAVLVNDVTNGTLTLSADGSFTYTPNQGFLGDDSFTYVANDGTDDSNIATVTLQRVSDSNEPPTANDDEAGTGPGTPVTIDVLDNDTDDDGTLDPSTVTITRNPSAGGTVTVQADGSIRYVPPNDSFTGEDTFRYTVADDDGAVSNEATVSVGVG